MPIETASFFVPTKAATAGGVLRALDDAGVIDGHISVDIEKLAGLDDGVHGPLADTLRAGEAEPAKVASVLEKMKSDGPSRVLHLYFRLVPPDTLSAPWKKELKVRLGALEPDPGELWVTHPFECWLALDLGDVEGTRLAASLSDDNLRPHPALPAPAMMPNAIGAKQALTGGVDVRTQPGNGAYLFFALEKAGVVRANAGPVVVRVLD